MFTCYRRSSELKKKWPRLIWIQTQVRHRLNSQHLPRLGQMKDTAVLLGNKPEQWPHAGPQQRDFAWTIASLCSSFTRFSLARLRQADHSLSHILPNLPACLRSAGAQLPMISQALGIKSHTVWKDVQDEVENHHLWFGRRKSPSSTSSPPPLSHLIHSAFHMDPWEGEWHGDGSQRWHHTWNDAKKTIFHYVDI